MSQRNWLGVPSRLVVVAAILLGLLLVLVIGYAIGKPLDHDEHQFVASGALLAREGLLPYVDYPYFHLPNLVFLYALVFLVSPYLLFSARMVSVLASVGTAAVLLGFAFWRLRSQGWHWQLAVGLAALLMLVFNPLYRSTTGLAWNHDVPTFLFLLGLGLGVTLGKMRRSRWWLVLAGVCFGLAAGSRATYVLPIPFVVAFLVANEEREGWRQRCMLILVGTGVGLLPSLLLLVMAPRAFIFGNLGYAGLNTQYREAQGFQGPMDAMEKLGYLADHLADPANVLVILLWGILLLLVVVNPRRTADRNRGSTLALAAAPVALMIGSLLPTPSWSHYFYAPVPLFILFVTWTVAPVLEIRPDAVRALTVLSLVMLTAAALVSYRSGTLLPSFPQGVVPLWTHRIGLRIKAAVGELPVITDSPVYPLEGGANIEPAVTTGPFALRIHHLVSTEDRARFHLIDQEDIEQRVREDRDVAILQGKDRFGLGYLAERFGFREVDVGANVRLWVP